MSLTEIINNKQRDILGKGTIRVQTALQVQMCNNKIQNAHITNPNWHSVCGEVCHLFHILHPS